MSEAKAATLSFLKCYAIETVARGSLLSPHPRRAVGCQMLTTWSKPFHVRILRRQGGLLKKMTFRSLYMTACSYVPTDVRTYLWDNPLCEHIRMYNASWRCTHHKDCRVSIGHPKMEHLDAHYRGNSEVPITCRLRSWQSAYMSWVSVIRVLRKFSALLESPHSVIMCS